jgi:hypothetical protein
LLDSYLFISIRFFLYDVVICFSVSFMSFFGSVIWVVVDCCEFVILYEIIYFMFVFLLRRYNYCCSIVRFRYGKGKGKDIPVTGHGGP